MTSMRPTREDVDAVKTFLEGKGFVPHVATNRMLRDPGTVELFQKVFATEVHVFHRTALAARTPEVLISVVKPIVTPAGRSRTRRAACSIIAPGASTTPLPEETPAKQDWPPDPGSALSPSNVAAHYGLMRSARRGTARRSCGRDGRCVQAPGSPRLLEGDEHHARGARGRARGRRAGDPRDRVFRRHRVVDLDGAGRRRRSRTRRPTCTTSRSSSRSTRRSAPARPPSSPTPSRIARPTCRRRSRSSTRSGAHGRGPGSRSSPRPATRSGVDILHVPTRRRRRRHVPRGRSRVRVDADRRGSVTHYFDRPTAKGVHQQAPHDPDVPLVAGRRTGRFHLGEWEEARRHVVRRARLRGDGGGSTRSASWRALADSATSIRRSTPRRRFRPRSAT